MSTAGYVACSVFCYSKISVKLMQISEMENLMILNCYAVNITKPENKGDQIWKTRHWLL